MAVLAGILFLTALAVYPYLGSESRALLLAVRIVVYLGAFAFFSFGYVRFQCSVAPNRISDRVARALDVSLFNIVLVAILLELALRGLSAVSSNPMFYKPSMAKGGERKFASTWRLKPGLRRLDFPVNSLGYYDEEFQREKPDDVFRIVAIGDSFGVGIVPHSYNYLTLLEDQLKGIAGDKRIEIFNISIVMASPEHYCWLLQNQGLFYEPDLIMVGFFMGNDFFASNVDPMYEARWDRLMIFRVLGRFARLRDAKSMSDEGGILWQISPGIPDYVEDWRLEGPTLPLDIYMGQKDDCAAWFDPDLEEEDYLGAVADLERFGQMALEATGKKPVLIIIPDELEVDAELRATVEHRLDIQLDLRKPYRILEEHLSPEGFVRIELFEAIDAEQKKSGRTYHLQDTHWNANGNRAAAREIARQLFKHPELGED